MSKIKNGGLDQYGAKPFEQQQFGTAGVVGVNCWSTENPSAVVIAHSVSLPYIVSIHLANIHIV